MNRTKVVAFGSWLALSLVLAVPSPADAYEKLPLTFEANRGQTDARVKFLARGTGYTLYLTSPEAVLALRAGGPEGPGASALRMRLVGGAESPRVTGVDELRGRSHYFIGSDPSRWRTNVPHYARVEYRAVYPGIDLIYYGNQRQLEFDFVVAPGADPGSIGMAFEGADRLELDARGDLVLHTAGAEIRLRKPLAYQDTAGIRQEVAVGYVLTDRQRVAFRIDPYDATRPLTIDPVLVYATYLGGSGVDDARAIAVDAAGHSYVTGSTFSSNFPTTAGVFQPANTGGSDAFVTKLNPAGSEIVYSAFLGGSATDVGQGVAVDGAGNAYVAGFTLSSNFPVTAGTFQTTPGSSVDAFAAKLSPTGAGLVYSSYLGGSDADIGLKVAVDGSANAYVTGFTQSSDFPVTAGAFQPSFGGGQDVFVTKLNATGSGLVYSTYLGGNSTDIARAIATDASGNAYVTGFTASTDFPTTAGAFQSVLGGGGDVLVAKLNAAGSGLVYSTFLGGSNFEEGQGIAVDALGSAYVTGGTASANFPVTAGAFQAAFGGAQDAFVTKLNAAGSGLAYSTYLGGTTFDAGSSIGVDASANAYVTGFTASSNFPTTTNAFQAGFGGVGDAFVTKLDPAGFTLVYSSYLGGAGVEAGSGIAVDTAGNAYVTGLTQSSNFPTTAGVAQPAFGGVQDAFVAKIGTDVVPFATFTVKLEIELTPGANEFELKSTFTTGAGSNGIAPLTEDLMLQIAGFTATIAAGAFKFVPAKPANKNGKGAKPEEVKFEGVVDGVALEAKLTPTGTLTFAGATMFEFKAEGTGANLAGTVNPVTVSLTIGNDSGTTAAAAEFE